MIVKTFIEQYQFLNHDLKRWRITSLKEMFYVLFEQGFWATVFYRVGRSLYMVNMPVVKIILRFIAFLMYKFSEVVFHVSIAPGTEVGGGLYVGHAGNVRLHPEAKAGANLSIGPGVIVGTKGVGHEGVPNIGDDVYIGTGAKLLGAIEIGSGVKIGANAVVLEDIPDGATAVGIPAKVIHTKEKRF